MAGSSGDELAQLDLQWSDVQERECQQDDADERDEHDRAHHEEHEDGEGSACKPQEGLLVDVHGTPCFRHAAGLLGVVEVQALACLGVVRTVAAVDATVRFAASRLGAIVEKSRLDQVRLEVDQVRLDAALLGAALDVLGHCASPVRWRWIV